MQPFPTWCWVEGEFERNTLFVRVRRLGVALCLRLKIPNAPASQKFQTHPLSFLQSLHPDGAGVNSNWSTFSDTRILSCAVSSSSAFTNRTEVLFWLVTTNSLTDRVYQLYYAAFDSGSGQNLTGVPFQLDEFIHPGASDVPAHQFHIG